MVSPPPEPRGAAAPLVIALDSGTSVVKATAFDIDGTLVASATRPNAYAMLRDGGAEQDMDRTWDDAAAVLASLADDLAQRMPGQQILGLAVTGQGDGTWLVDADGAPTGPGLIWLDSRSSGIVDDLKASGAAQAAFAYTGTGLAACQQVPQLLWLERHRPDMVRRAAWSLHPKDFLHHRLTGVFATSPCEGNFTFGDFRSREYRDEVLRALGIERFRRLLPPMLEGTRHAHGLTRAAAERTHLPAGLPVVLGYVDVACTTLGAGIFGTAEEAGVTIVGSTGMHIRLVPDPAHVAPSPAQTGYCICFPVPGHTLQAQSNMAASINIDWLVGIAMEGAALAGAAPSREALLRAFDDSVLAARPGAVLYHPFISQAGERGPFTDAQARAAILGLDQDVRLIDLARGIYEGLALAARDCYAAAGGAPAQIRATGGAARSRALCAILASALDRPVLAAAQQEGGAAGAAMMAVVQQGVFADMRACAARWIVPHTPVPAEPDAGLAATYDRLFPIYRAAYQALRPTWSALHAHRQASYEPFHDE